MTAPMPENAADRVAKANARESEERARRAITDKRQRKHDEQLRLIEEISEAARSVMAQLNTLDHWENADLIDIRTRSWRRTRVEQKAGLRVAAIRSGHNPETGASGQIWFHLDSDGIVRTPHGDPLTQEWVAEFWAAGSSLWGEFVEPATLRRVLLGLEELGRTGRGLDFS